MNDKPFSTDVHLSECEKQSQWAKKFIPLAESYCDFEEVTPTAINEFISKIVVFENELTEQIFQDKLLKMIATEKTA